MSLYKFCYFLQTFREREFKHTNATRIVHSAAGYFTVDDVMLFTFCTHYESRDTRRNRSIGTLIILKDLNGSNAIIATWFITTVLTPQFTVVCYSEECTYIITEDRY